MAGDHFARRRSEVFADAIRDESEFQEGAGWLQMGSNAMLIAIMTRGGELFLRGMLTVSSVLMAVPAIAQIDLSGNWAARAHEDWQERGPGPEAVDYLGIPINEEARSRALAYSTSALSLPERQCLYY